MHTTLSKCVESTRLFVEGTGTSENCYRGSLTQCAFRPSEHTTRVEDPPGDALLWRVKIPVTYRVLFTHTQSSCPPLPSLLHF